MKIDGRNIFLIDGTGAGLSAASAGFILPYFATLLGLSTRILYSLAVLGSIYALYSLICFFLLKTARPGALLIIIAANIIYCLITGALVTLLEGLSIWGRAYLIAEALIILGLVLVEVRVYFQGRASSPESLLLH